MNARFFLWSCKLINYFTAPFTRYHESASQRQRRILCGRSYFGTQNNLTRMCAHLTFETRRRRAESFIHLPWKIFQIKATVFSRVTRFQRGLSSANTSGASLNMVTCTSEWFNISFREIIDKTEAKKREEQYIQKRFELINCLRMLTLLTFDLFFSEFIANSSCTTSMVSLNQNSHGSSSQEIVASSYKYLLTN